MAERSTRQRYRMYRRVLALGLAIATIGAVTCGFVQLKSINVQSLSDLTVNGMVTELIGLKRDESDKLFDVALIVMGALFALILAKKDEARIVLGDVPEMIMFLCAVGLLGASLGCDMQYQSVLGDALLRGGEANQGSMPNIFSSQFEAFHVWQFRFLIAGSVAAALTLTSAHRLKGDDPNG